MRETNHEHEHEFEASRGLPEPLPSDESLLWQGSPHAWAMARDVFHVRGLAAYFALILSLRAATVWSGGESTQSAVLAALHLMPLAIFALAALGLLAWLSSRTTVYTLTNKRVVMRIGIVLTLTFNLPLRSLVAANLRARKDGTGDIPLQLLASEKIAWIHLWPHARPWRVSSPEPMLRCVPQAAVVAERLSTAWQSATAHDWAIPQRRGTTESAKSSGHATSSLSPT